MMDNIDLFCMNHLSVRVLVSIVCAISNFMVLLEYPAMLLTGMNVSMGIEVY